MPSPEDFAPLVSPNDERFRMIQTTVDDIPAEVTTSNLVDVVYPPTNLTDVRQNTEALEALELHTEPTAHHRRSALRRLNILQQKQEQPSEQPASSRSSLRQVIYLREENRRLRDELHGRQGELQHLLQEHERFQSEVSKEVTVIHNGYKLEIAHYQAHLQDLMEERNRIQDAYVQATQLLQESQLAFEAAILQEAHSRLAEALRLLETSSENVPPLLQEAVRILDARARQVEDKHLVEALFLKHEVQTLVTQVRAAWQELEIERRQLAIIQSNARQQAELRQKTLHSRIRARWRVASVSMSVGLLALMVVLQYAFLGLFHVAIPVPVSLSILAPIMLCIVLAIVFSQPLANIKRLYTGGPHKKVSKQK